VFPRANRCRRSRTAQATAIGQPFQPVRRREDEHELVFLVSDQNQVLVIDNAVLRLQFGTHREDQALVGIGKRLHRQVSAPVSGTSISTTQRAISSPMPASPLLKPSLFLNHSLSQPVLKKIACPGLISVF
jgi:hypothetical protein